MAYNLGKKFEERFKQDFSKIPNSSIDRIMDSMSHYKYISGISDFICYVHPNIFYLELKSHKGNTFPLTNLTQYDALKYKVGIKGVRVGVVLWMISWDVVVYLPISFITYLKENNYKSFNVKMIDNDNLKKMFITIPSVKKRVMMSSDYTVLLNLAEGW